MIPNGILKIYDVKKRQLIHASLRRFFALPNGFIPRFFKSKMHIQTKRGTATKSEIWGHFTN